MAGGAKGQVSSITACLALGSLCSLRLFQNLRAGLALGMRSEVQEECDKPVSRSEGEAEPHYLG